MNSSPRAYGVPHDDWREHQLETVQWIQKTPSPLIVQAKTGSGKSATGGALGRWGDVRSLTHTLNLQEQYKEYGFEPLYGMANYPCELLRGVTANDCTYPEAMHQCPVRTGCEYLVRRDIVKQARRQSLSYAYFLRANWIHDNPTRYLYADEAHLIKDILIDHATIEYTPMNLQVLELPMYPRTMPAHELARKKVAANWLNEVLLEMKREYTKLVDLPKETIKRSARIRSKMRRISRDITTLGNTLNHMDIRPEFFYVHWNLEQFKLIPLTARPYFKSVFMAGWPHKLVMTSATIGNVETFARELGLNHYNFRDVPSNFPPQAMPVFDLGAPRMGHALSQNGWAEWGDLIAKHVNDLNPSWSGIIHVASHKQALSLADMLARNGLQDRVYVPKGRGTREKIADWSTRKKKIPNTLAIAYSFHMGLDAPDDEINIVAKVPFATLDEFGKALLRFDAGVYHYNAALLTEQAMGRIRRGNSEDYEEEGEPMRKFVAIADGNYVKVEQEFSKHFKECITSL